MSDDSERHTHHSTTFRPVLQRGAWGPPLAALLVTLVALGIYAATAAPGLTLAFGGTDGGELAVAVHTLGIPHPSGYPTYVLLARAVGGIGGGTPAGRLSFFSALAAALTVGLVALLAAELAPEQERRFPALMAALTAGFALTTAGLFWSQAVIAEVYTLHTFFLALDAWLLVRWRRRGGPYLLLAGLTLGIGLGNHLSLAFFGLGAAVFVALSPRRRAAPAALAALAAGLLVYLYLPLRAAGDPWLNWGDPRSPAAFWEHVSAAAYRRYLFAVPWGQILGRLSTVAGLLWRDFPWGVPLGLAGAPILARRDRNALLLLLIPAGLGLLLALTYGGADSYVHLLPLYVAWALLAGVAAGAAAAALRDRLGGRAALAMLLLPLLGLPLLVRGWRQWNLRGAMPASVPLGEALAAMPTQGILLTNADEHTFPLWYVQVVEGVRPDVAVVDVRLLEWPWYRAQLPSRYPGLAAAEEGAGDRLRALLKANGGRPALTLGPLPLPDGYLLRNAGPLFEVVPSAPLSPPC